jgi:hypothetical protein
MATLIILGICAVMFGVAKLPIPRWLAWATNLALFAVAIWLEIRSGDTVLAVITVAMVAVIIPADYLLRRVNR